MAVMVPKCQHYGTWVYPPIRAVLETVGLDDIVLYIARRKNMFAHYIATLAIMDLCLAAEREPVMLLSRWWSEQTALDTLGIRAGRAAEEVRGGQGRINQRERERARETESRIVNDVGKDTEMNEITRDDQM